MGANASRVQNTPDYDPSVVLRSAADAAEATTVIEASVSLKELRTAWWHNYEIPHGKIVIDVEVTELDVAGTNAYALDLVVDDVSAMNNTPVMIASIPIPVAGVYTIVVDTAKIPTWDTDHGGLDKFMAIRATMSGDSTPSIRYGARISKSLGA